jgi:hypothetical protein
VVFTRYRGRLYIHAAVRIDTSAPNWAWPAPGDELPQGAIIGYVTLAGCSQGYHASRWATDYGGGGGWHWWLRDPVLLPQPVPCRGRQNLWPLPPEVLERIGEE